MAKQGEKWRKSGTFDHGILLTVIFVIIFMPILLRSQLTFFGRKPLKTDRKRKAIPERFPKPACSRKAQKKICCNARFFASFGQILWRVAVDLKK
jgi:hypothetical protein